MEERKRIIELVEQGILSAEEALTLLENLGKKQSNEKEFVDDTLDETIQNENEVKDALEDDEDLEAVEDFLKENEGADEPEIDPISEEFNEYTEQIEIENEKLDELLGRLDELQDSLAEKRERHEEKYAEECQRLKHDIKNLNREKELIELVVEVDNEEEIKAIEGKIAQKQEALEKIQGINLDNADEETSAWLKEEAALKEEIEATQERRNDIRRKLHSLKLKQWANNAKRATSQINIPKDWMDEAEKHFDKAYDSIEESSKNFESYVQEWVGKAKSALENFEWKDVEVNFSVPTLSEETFQKSWTFEDTSASILDFKNAHGDIIFELSDNDDIQIDAHFKIFGRYDEENVQEALRARSDIQIDEDTLKFHVFSKKVEANMIVRLPNRVYDYISVNTLNSAIDFKSIQTKDMFLKSTNGDINIEKIQGTMLEIKGVNGEISVRQAKLRDFVASTINGDLRYVGNVCHLDVSLTNGTIRLTLKNNDIKRIIAHSVNGQVKLSIPADLTVNGKAMTKFGRVKSQLRDFDINPKGTRQFKFKSEKDGTDPAKVRLKTTTGNILLKN